MKLSDYIMIIYTLEVFTMLFVWLNTKEIAYFMLFGCSGVMTLFYTCCWDKIVAKYPLTVWGSTSVFSTGKLTSFLLFLFLKDNSSHVKIILGLNSLIETMVLLVIFYLICNLTKKELVDEGEETVYQKL